MSDSAPRHWFDAEVVRNDADLCRRIRNLKLIAFDFDGVFTDNAVLLDETGIEHIRSSRYDGIGLRRLESVGVKAVIISTEVNPVVLARARKLKLECVNACENKVSALGDFLTAIGAEFSEAGFVGNDINDLPALARVNLPMVTADCHPEVSSVAKYKTRITGGNGAVREICDMIYHVRSPENHDI